MGEAKRRGTFEQRKAGSAARQLAISNAKIAESMRKFQEDTGIDPKELEEREKQKTIITNAVKHQINLKQVALLRSVV